MIQKTPENAFVFWQEPVGAVPEPAILITAYSDCLELQQDDQTIRLNLDVLNQSFAFLNPLASDMGIQKRGI